MFSYLSDRDHEIYALINLYSAIFTRYGEKSQNGNMQIRFINARNIIEGETDLKQV